MAPHLPDAEAVARLRGNLAALGPVRLPLGIGFSGGPDSLALLLLAQAAFPGEVRAATVDHGLRQAAAAEAEHAKGVCAQLGIPHTTLRVDVAAGASVQAQARDARYQALAGWMAGAGITALLTAHHLDDQAETLLMRLLRGAGVAGLAGVRARRLLVEGCEAELLRPLLGWRRAELAEIVAASGLEAVTDPSNADQAFDRVRIRKLLAEAPWLDPDPLARSAAALADAEEALEAMTARCLAQAVEQHADHLLLRPADLPAEIQRRLLLRCLHLLAPAGKPRGEQVMEALRALTEGRTVTLAGIKLSPQGAAWRIELAPPRRLAQSGEIA
ncbi:MAG TPA: tRNA lysidine(34) synthetase TilS [Allosphingosinicella sp.]|jgi:tRNA(Ile)-lysidine synthase